MAEADVATGDTAGGSPQGGAVARVVVRVLGVFRNPVQVFLILGLLSGVYLACVVPHFGGIDETAHFYRSYQVSTGTFVPEKPHGSSFSGACVPIDVVLGVDRDVLAYYEHLLTLEGKTPPNGQAAPTAADVRRCPGDPSQGFVTFSTFGSPVPYLPQAAAIFVARKIGWGVDGMLILARLVALAAYVTLVGFAIKRTPRAKWAFCTVGLLPVALFQASASLSHDTITVALAMFVVSSALRCLDPPPGVSDRSLVIEALVLTTLLAFCKPGYVVVSLAYLFPLLARDRRRSQWPLALAPVLGALVSLGWNAVVGGLWKTDAGYFGVHVNPARQQHLLVTQPWTFAGAALNTVTDSLWSWAKALVVLGPSVSVWPTVLLAAAVGVFLLVSLQPGRRDEPGLSRGCRALALVICAIGVLLPLGAQYVYWTRPGADFIGGMQARFFVPVLVLLPIALGPLRFRWADPIEARIPLAILLVPVLLGFCVSLTYRMY